MFRFVILLAAIIGSALAGILPNALDGRIVNGVATTIESHPYQVSLQNNAGNHFCGGSIISSDIVVTAAHCMNRKASAFKVRLGTTQYNKGGEVVAVKSFKVHENYNSNTNINDVAIIKLATPVKSSAKIQFVELAQTTPKNGTKAVVTGWGTTCYLVCSTLPTTLQRVEVNIVSNDACGSKSYGYGSKIQPSMVCAYAESKDACQGDSGGPLVADNKLVGVVSWGYGCAIAGYPGVYSEVAHVHDWIVKTSKSL